MFIRKLISIVTTTALTVSLGTAALFNPALAQEKEMAKAFVMPKAHKFTEDTIPQVELSGSLLFQLIASEIALQRREAGAAFSTYMTMAVDTGDPRLAQRAYEIALQAKAPMEMLKAAQLWNKLAPGNPVTQEILLTQGVHLGEYNKILPLARSYLSQVNDPTETINFLAEVLTVSKYPKKAVNFFRQATEKFKKLPETKLGLGRLEALAGNKKSALQNLRAAYKQKPDTDTVLALSEVLLEEKTAASKKEANRLLTQYLTKNPDDVKVRNTYAQILLTSGELNALNDLVKKYSKDPEFQVSGAVSLLKNGKEAEAKGLLDKISKMPQTDPEFLSSQKALLLLSEIELEKQNFQAAINYTDQVTGRMKPSALIQKANIYSRQDKPREALNTLRTIDTKAYPGLAEEVAALEARLIAELDGDQAALKFLQNVIKKYPESVSLYYEAAMLAERNDDVKTTEMYLKKALEIDPSFTNAYNSLGYTLLERTDRIKDAEEYIKKAYELEPENPYILDSMGWLSYKQKRYDEAVLYLTEALESLESEDIMLHLAEVYWVSDQRDEARLILKRARELWPDSDDINGLIKSLGIE